MVKLLRKGQLVVRVKGVDELVFNIPRSDILIGAETGKVYTPTYRHGPKRYLGHKDIFSAIRQRDHIFETYFGIKGLLKGELADLLSLIDQITFLVMALDKNSSPETKKEIEKSFGDLALALERKINEYKVIARKRLERATKVNDRRGRRNPSAQEASATGASFALRRRIKQIIADITVQEKRRKNILEEEVSYLENKLAEVLKELVKIEGTAKEPRIALALCAPCLTALFLFAPHPYRRKLTTASYHLARAVYAKNEEKAGKALRMAIRRLSEAAVLSSRHKT